MKIEINLGDYLNEEEIKEECRLAVRECIRETCRSENNIDVLISNLSYLEVFEMVNDCIDGDLATLLKNKCKEVIDNLSEYIVFGSGTEWGRKPAEAYIILRDVLINSKPRIEQRVSAIIDGYDYREIKDSIGDVVYECIMDRLFKESDNNEVD